MMRYFFSSAAAVVCAGAFVAAQAPAGQTPSQPQGGAQGESSRPTAQASGGATTTVTGCVYREADVPGRTPNVAERAGILEDYILADVRMNAAAGSGATGTSGVAGAPAAGAGAGGAVGGGAAPGGAAAGGAAATTGSSSASASNSSMYKLELIDDNRLQALVGKRVEVTGRIDRESGDSGGRTQGTTGVGGGAATGSGSTGAPGAVSGNPGSAGNTGARTGSAGAGAGNAGAGAAGNAGAPAAGDQARAGQADQSIGPDRIELPEFEVTSIREIAGTCAATPAAR